MFYVKIWLMDKLGYFAGGEYGKIFSRLLTIEYITLILLLVLAIVGITILWNQRKIKKQLRQLLENKKEEDKP